MLFQANKDPNFLWLQNINNHLESRLILRVMMRLYIAPQRVVLARRVYTISKPDWRTSQHIILVNYLPC